MTRLSTLRRRDALTWLAGAGASAAAPALRAAEPKRVRYILSIPSMTSIVANQTSIPRLLGYYEAEGVRVEPVLAGAAGVTGAVQLVATGDQDIGSGSYTPMMTRAAEGQDMGLACFYLQVRNYAMTYAVPADSALRGIADLRGKLIGVPTLANEGVPLSRFLARDAGMDPQADLRFIAVGAGAQAGQALRSRQIDVYVAPRSQVTQIETMGIALKVLPLPTRMRELFGVGLFARRDYLKSQRATAVGVGRAVAKSTIFAMSNPEAAVRLHWKAYPEQMPQGMPPEQALDNAVKTLRTQFEGLRFQEHESGVTQYGRYRPEAVAAVLDVFGWSAKIANPQSYFTNDLIDEINAFDREKIVQQARAWRG
jgi:NitT/TauT family transport system substrate-binding protein